MAEKATPTISTPRLTLRHLTRPSAQQIAWLHDPEVVRYSEQRHHRHTLHSQLKYINTFTGGSHIWGIYRVEKGEHIGNLTATYDGPNRLADMGIMIGDTTVWGQGYGSEAWDAAARWLLDPKHGGLRKLEAGCMRANDAMMQIFRKTGFIHEGDRSNHFILGGGMVSAALFGRFG